MGREITIDLHDEHRLTYLVERAQKWLDDLDRMDGKKGKKRSHLEGEVPWEVPQSRLPIDYLVPVKGGARVVPAFKRLS